MSKYNVGDKFILRIIKDDTMEIDTNSYYITNDGRLLEESELDKLQKYEEVQIPHSEAYNKGLEDGRNEVWELANKLFGYSCDTKLTNEDLKKIFGSACEMDILRNFTPQEALAKLEAYEKEQNKIKAGYVYEIMGKFCAVVQVDEFNNEYHIIWCDGGTDRIPFETPIGFKKTGKHIDISSILQQIGE